MPSMSNAYYAHASLGPSRRFAGFQTQLVVSILCVRVCVTTQTSAILLILFFSDTKQDFSVDLVL
jgi:hypothetical protein